MATHRQLGEVESSCICENKLHCLDEEGLKRFAEICLTGEGFRNHLSELDKDLDFYAL